MQDIEKFIRGFSRYQAQYLREPTQLDSLRQGHHPRTLVIGCCDARVDPALLTGCDPGDIFVVRNIANLVPPCAPDAPPGVSSAIEFAVCGLEVARIIVLGHARCGGIRSLMSGERMSEEAEETGFVARWMRLAEPVRQDVLRALHHKHADEQCRAAELASILHSLDNLVSYPWIRRRVEAGTLALHGWYFDLAAGTLLAYSARKQEFLPILDPVAVPRSALTPRAA